MKRSFFVVGALSLAAVVSASFALEGKWTPQQLGQLDRAWLTSQGLGITPEELWNDSSSTGLLSAVVDLDGCSAALVSPDGLLVTNHHCVMSTLQQLSRPGADLIANGFLAADRAAELPGGPVKVQLPIRFTDVTAAVSTAIQGKTDDRARALAIEQARREMVASCERTPGRRCQVAVFDDGLRYVLVEALEFPDVRLVYAPPKAVGDFGGEVDNWMWPRHTGDFAFLRVYAGPDGSPAKTSRSNVPLKSVRHIRVSTHGVKPGEFVMGAGYPWRSFRSLTAAEMGERAALYFPQRTEILHAWLQIMETASAADEDVRLALADRVKSIANDEKNARAQVAGLARGNFVEKKWAFESAVLDWAKAHPEQRDAVAAYQALDAIVAERRAMWRHDLLLESMTQGSIPMAAALRLVRWARERGKPDMERKPGFMERDRDRLKETLVQEEKQVDLPTEEALLVALFERLAALPEGARSKAVDRQLGGALDHEDIKHRVDALFASSRVTDVPSEREMFDESVAGLRLRRDPLLEFAFAVDDELREVEARRERWQGAAAVLKPRWLNAVAAFQGRPVAPDANETLRLSFGHVMGYAPHDAVVMLPQTRVAGMLEKDTGRDPFALPAVVRAGALNASASPWADATLGDVPVAFLADLDTTGGNSGSPVLNASGELVGLNFDRVWENVANDFGYDQEVNRNISLDVRFLLWYLDAVEGLKARPLLAELGVAPAR
jgi:hypothetical protein